MNHAEAGALLMTLGAEALKVQDWPVEERKKHIAKLVEQCTDEQKLFLASFLRAQGVDLKC